MNRGTATSNGDLQWQRDSSGSQKPPGLKNGMTFDEIKAKCLKEKQRYKDLLFEDPEFPADETLLYYKIRPGLKGGPPFPYEWKRPRDIVKEIHHLKENSELFVDGASQYDIRQLYLGDCWMLASMSCLSMHPKLRKKVVPDGQSFKDGEYAGIFHFNIWKFGEWVEVIIDDRLPVDVDGLVYTSSSAKNEFWTALLEKAYAKFYGSYININGGGALKALEDFTGGIGETVKMVPGVPSRKLWNIMLKAHERKSLMCCSTETTNPEVKYLKNGLVSGHVYSVTSVVWLSRPGKKWGNLELVVVRNPWGKDDETEGGWNGVWRDSSERWEDISDSEQQLIGYKKDEKNGEFCMSFEEFEKSFVELHICHLDPNSFTDDAGVEKGKRWEVKSFKGCWKKGVNAGGYGDSRTFLKNPQYRFEVVDSDERDSNGRPIASVIIALMQREREKGRGDLRIGYAISKLENPVSAGSGLLDKNFKFQDFINDAKQVSQQREICDRYPLRPGSYCVIPFTADADEEGDFILRIFTEKPINSEELDEPTGKIDPRRSEVKPVSEDRKKCEEIWEGFQKNSGGTNGTLDVWHLKKILNAEFVPGFTFDGFSDATCKSLVELKQAGRSSMFGYTEFVEIWTLLQEWKVAFMDYDIDGNGTFDSYELREAMHAIGYSVSNGTFTALVQNYSKNRKIHFDDFVRGMARLSTKLDEYRGSNSLVSLEEFLQRHILKRRM